MGSGSSDSAWMGPWAAMEPELTESEKALRDRFVDEYLIDYSPLNAARRVGFSNSFAEEYAKRFMGESYVKRRITFQETRPDLDPEEMDEYDKRRVRNRLMREAHDHFSTGSSRVAALGKLMSLFGMDAPKKVEDVTKHRGGVMVVPVIASMDEWERTAMASQAQLAADAASDIH